MQVVEGTLVLSATDLTVHLECEHLTELRRQVLAGALARPPERDDPQLELLRRRGDEHEQACLDRLTAAGRRVLELDGRFEGLSGLRALHERTVAAMRAGWEHIYQGTFFDGLWHGRPDFLRRVDTPSALGPWSYEVEDAKLARRPKVAALVQLAEYSRQVAAVQGTAPRRIHVLLGHGAVESRPLADVSAYQDQARRRFEAAVAAGRQPTYPLPVEHCRVCEWSDACVARRRLDDHLSLVAGAHASQIAKLEAAGVRTAASLARRVEPVPRLGEAALLRLSTQARLQGEGRTAQRLLHELLERSGEHRGLATLPRPDDGDVFFDIEGDSLYGEHGLEYLFGLLEQHDGAYRTFWGHDAAQERRAFEGFIDYVMARLERHTQLHVYHYGAYEPSALKRLAGRYATREDELDRLLRGRVLVDLYAVVRGALQASTESYSLKSLEPLYMARRTGAIVDGGSSVVVYERWLDDHDPARLRDLAEYNRTDCHSTQLLRAWLEERRDEYAVRFGEPVPRPGPAQSAPAEKAAASAAETEALVGALTRDVPDDDAARTEEERARVLLAAMLDWHRREARPEWWEFFARCDMDRNQLLDDGEAVAGLEPDGDAAVDGRAAVQRYRFPTPQETRVDVGDAWVDPASRRTAGVVVGLDRAAGTLDLRRSPAQQERGHPRALVPRGPYDTEAMRRAMRRAGQWVVDHGIDAPGPYRAARDLLLRRPPRTRWSPGSIAGEPHAGTPLVHEGESPVDAARRVALTLDGGCLPIQGPPGSGKTYTAAQIALDLCAQGRRVGVTALSHRAISRLLDEICDEAQRRGAAVRIVQRADAGQGCAAPFVRCVAETGSVLEAIASEHVDVVAGTSWLFSREELEGVVDTLIVDEASQMSLANVVATSGAARNLVLCGDPQQLDQPTKGTHPAGAERSALEHVLGADHTIGVDRGVFLDVTRRMHSALCAVVSEVFYDSRLHAAPECDSQGVRAPIPGLEPAGLHHVAVEHAGNAVTSPEEAEVVSLLTEAFLDGTWTDARGRTHAVEAGDVIVLAPYNAQVTTIARLVPRDVRVGTVDRFQGQQAAIAIYSMATSSGDESRRGMEFLYSLNRLNVALSRARAVSVLVCSPELMRVNCRTVDQLVLANALCRLVARAAPLRVRALQGSLALRSAG